jgi:hypothetical protein
MRPYFVKSHSKFCGTANNRSLIRGALTGATPKQISNFSTNYWNVWKREENAYDPSVKLRDFAEDFINQSRRDTMTKRTIEVEASSLEEARELVQSQIPDGFRVLSEEVVSEVYKETARATADTIEVALEKVQSRVPRNADIIDTKVLTEAERSIFAVEAFDEPSAREQVERQIAKSAKVEALRLVTPGRKGFLGIRKKPNQYEAEIVQQAAVEVTYKTKAKISTQIISSSYVYLIGHLGVVRAVSTSADGSIIVTGGYDATVRLWNPATGQEIGKFNTNSDIGTLAMSPDGTKVIIGCKSNSVEVWEVRSGKRLIQMKGHKAFPCSSMACSQDGRWAVSASWDENGVFLWDLVAGNLERHIVHERYRTSAVSAVSVAFSNDNTRLAFGCPAGVFEHEVPSGKLITQLEGHPNGRCVFLKYLDDDTIASISAIGDVKIQSVSKRSIQRQLQISILDLGRTISAGAVSDDGRRVVLGAVSEWDIETGTDIGERTKAHGDNQVMAVMYMPGTYTWVSCDVEGAVTLWNPVGPVAAPATVPTKTPTDQIQELEDFLKQRPDWTFALEKLAGLYWHHQDNVVNLFRYIYAAAQSDPDSNEPHRYLKEIYLGLGRSDDFNREAAADKRTDPHAHLGGSEWNRDYRERIQRAARANRGELEAVIRELSD